MEIWRRVWYDLNGKISLQDGRHNDDNFVGNFVKKVNTELKNLSESREIEKMWNQFESKNCFVENNQYCDVIKTISTLILNIYS